MLNAKLYLIGNIVLLCPREPCLGEGNLCFCFLLQLSASLEGNLENSLQDIRKWRALFWGRRPQFVPQNCSCVPRSHTTASGAGGMPHSAQSQHTNYWAPRTRKRHQQEHRPQRPTESSDPTQHAKGRTGDRPGPRKGAATRWNVTQGGWHKALVVGSDSLWRRLWASRP